MAAQNNKTQSDRKVDAKSLSAVFLDSDSLAPEDLDLRVLEQRLPNARYYPQTAAKLVAERIADAEIVLSNKVQIGAQEMDAASRLKLIVILATGSNNVNLAAAKARGIVVCNIVNYATDSLVEHCFALMLALMRQLPAHNQLARSAWPDHEQFCLLSPGIQELKGKTLGLVGLGASARGLAKRAEAFGMNVIAMESLSGSSTEDYPRMPLEALLSKSDVLSLHCPLNEATRGLIGEAELANMKNNAVLINCARGGIVDEDALAKALEAGHIAGAGVDVLSTEPPREGNPLLNCSHPNLILTAHNAWGSQNARQALIDQAATVIDAWQRRSPINWLNP